MGKLVVTIVMVVVLMSSSVFAWSPFYPFKKKKKETTPLIETLETIGIMGDEIATATGEWLRSLGVNIEIEDVFSEE